jgi:anti-sigma28 factor (negative regulator of flagellin synthesis)
METEQMRLQFGTNGTAATGIAPTAVESTSGSRKPAVASSTSQDQISLSSTSSIINRDATNRAGRIEQLTLAVQSGTYSVPSQALGSRIVSAALGN